MTSRVFASRISVVLLALATSTIVPPAWAEGVPRSLADYAKIAGEAGVAHADCNMELDFAKLQKLGAPFTLNPGDAAAVETASAVVAGAMAEASQRRQAEGEGFCADALDKYGPAGSRAAGLLTKRPE